MLKEILGTILLTAFSVKAPRNVQNENYLNVKGYYCLKNTLGDIDVSQLWFGTEQEPFIHYVQEQDGFYTQYNALSMNKQVVSNTTYYNIVSYYYEGSAQQPTYTYNVSFTSLELSDATAKTKNFLMYVPYNYAIDVASGNAGRFSTWFTNEGNAYMQYYAGWYYFTSGTTNVNYQIIGSFMINNALYGSLEYQSNYVTATMPSYMMTEYQENVPVLTIYDDGWLIKDKNIYVQAMLSNDVYNKMASTGTFAYVPSVNPNTYSFEDLFFNIADTPIYFIYSLFNWKLFGANLFIAFTGLISFALILILFRTFVWKK